MSRKKLKQYSANSGLGLKERMEQSQSVMRDPSMSDFNKKQAAARFIQDASGGLNDSSFNSKESVIRGEQLLNSLEDSRVNTLPSNPTAIRRANQSVRSEDLKGDFLIPESIVGREKIQFNALAAAAGQEPPDTSNLVDSSGLEMRVRANELLSTMSSRKPTNVPEFSKDLDGGGFASYNTSNNEIPQGLIEVPGSNGRVFAQPEGAERIQQRQDKDFYQSVLDESKPTGFVDTIGSRMQKAASARKEASSLGQISSQGLMDTLQSDSALTGTALTFGGKRAKESADTILGSLVVSGLDISNLNNAEQQKLASIRMGLQDPMSNTRREASQQLQGLISGALVRRSNEASERTERDLEIQDLQQNTKMLDAKVENLTSKFVAGTSTVEETRELGRAMQASADIRNITDPKQIDRKLQTAATYLTTINSVGQKQIQSLQDQIESAEDENTIRRLQNQISTIQTSIAQAKTEFMSIYEGTNYEGMTADDLVKFEGNQEGLEESQVEVEEETTESEVTEPLAYELSSDMKKSLDKNLYDFTNPELRLEEGFVGGFSPGLPVPTSDSVKDISFEQRLINEYRSLFDSDEAFEAFFEDQQKKMIDRLTKESTPGKGLERTKEQEEALKRLKFVKG